MNLDPTWIASNSADSIGTLEQREAVMAAKVAVGNELELLYQEVPWPRRFMWSGVWGSIPVSPCSTTASCVANLDVNGPPTNRRKRDLQGTTPRRAASGRSLVLFRTRAFLARERVEVEVADMFCS